MKKNITILMSFIVILTCSSCLSKLILKKMGVLDESAKTMEITDGNKRVIFVPMHHIGKKSFYDDVKSKIESYKKDGFVVYYEGARVDRGDSLYVDTLLRKFRMLTRVDPVYAKATGGYIDTAENTFMGMKFKLIGTEKLQNQPSNIRLGVDTSTDVRADVYYSDIISSYEKKYGPLVLTNCDIKSPLGQKYTCKKAVKVKNTLDIILNSRNEYLYQLLLKEERKKIVVIYGSKHFSGLFDLLKNHDPAWKKI